MHPKSTSPTTVLCPLLKEVKISTLFNAAQIILLLIYLSLNIIFIRDEGVALPVLVGAIILAVCSVLLRVVQHNLTISRHFLVFLLFILWNVFRVLADIQDIEYLKQVTIATSNGILLFFLTGSFIRHSICQVNRSRFSIVFYKILMFTSLAISILILFNYKKMMPDPNKFYVYIINGGYQRIGNFLIIYFITLSFIWTSLASNLKHKSFLLWLLIYSGGFFNLIVSSQIIGSNGATVNLLAVYLLTVVFSLLSNSKKVRSSFAITKGYFYTSKVVCLAITKYFVAISILSLLASLLIINLTGFDIKKTRLFGFGSWENDSLTSRIEILWDLFFEQVGFAPIFGNSNVAYLTTGDSGRYLHNFLPNLFSELGLLGIIIFLTLFLMVIFSLIKKTRSCHNINCSFKQSLEHAWLIAVLVFLFFFSNIAVNKNWIVFWYFLGFSVRVFGCTQIVKKRVLNEF